MYFGHGTDNPFDEAAYIIAYVTEASLDYDDSFYSTELDSEQSARIDRLVSERIETRKPLAYITHEAFFAGLKFYVDERVLVPRSPLAELIEDEFLPWVEPELVKNILDLCTGSGCIGIACAKKFVLADVVLADVDEAALEVAKINVKQHELETCIRLVQSDLFESVPSEKYDIIISNPPYVDAQDMAALPDEYRHEPAHGLEAGDDGLLFVDRILYQSSGFLSEQGILVVEVGNSADALMNKYPDVPFVWLEFEFGGEGVFLLDAGTVKKYFQ